MLGCAFGRRSQRDFVETEPGAGKLPIISGRIGGLTVEGSRVLFAAQRFSRTALPVEGARQGDRIADALGDPGKMRQRRARLMKESQGDPSSREMLLGPMILFFRTRCRICDFISEPGIAKVE